MDFLTLVWLMPLVLFVHEMEEWKILSWYERIFINLPLKTNASIRSFLVFVSLFGFVWTYLATRFESHAVGAIMIGLLAAVILLNAIQHIYWSFLFRQYAPGVITSIVLLVPL